MAIDKYMNDQSGTAPTLGVMPPPGLPSPIVRVAPTLDSMFSLNKEGGVDIPKSPEELQSGLFTGSGQAVHTGVQDMYNPSQFGEPSQVGGSRARLNLSPTGEATAHESGLVLPGDKQSSDLPSSVIRGFTPPSGLQAPPEGLSTTKPQAEAPTEEDRRNTFLDANTYYTACVNSSIADTGGKSQHEYCYLATKKETGKTPTISAVGEFSPDNLPGTASDTSPIDLQDMLDLAISTGDWSEFESWFNEIKSTNPEFADLVANQVESSIEALAKGKSEAEFKANMYLNPRALADALGMPLEIMETFTADIFGGEKAEDLEEVARQKYQLGMWEADLLKRHDEHLTASTRYADYIRGKDEYLGKLDEMLYKLGEERNNIDMSDPHMASRYNNYKNYLTGLKGAQSKRYIDVLNDSLAYEQNDYDLFVRQYESQIGKVESFIERELGDRELSREKSMQLLPYVTDALTGLYRSANGISDIAEEKRMLENAKMLETVSIINSLKGMDFDIDKLAEINPDIAKYAGAINADGASDVAMSAGDKKLITSDYKLNTGAVYSNGEIQSIDVLSIGDLIGIGENLQLKDIGLMIKRYGSDVSKIVQNKVGENGDLEASINPYIKALERDELDENGITIASEYIDTIYAGAEEGMKKYLVDEHASTMKTIMRKMLLGKIKSKEELIKKYGDKIDEWMLETLWETDEKLRSEIFNESPGMYESIDDVPHLGIAKEMWDDLLNDPEAMATYFLGNVE